MLEPATSRLLQVTGKCMVVHVYPLDHAHTPSPLSDKLVPTIPGPRMLQSHSSAIFPRPQYITCQLPMSR